MRIRDVVIKPGDRVICKISGVMGTVEKEYTPTASGPQVMVITDDGRRYHAPKSEWVLIGEIV